MEDLLDDIEIKNHNKTSFIKRIACSLIDIAFSCFVGFIAIVICMIINNNMNGGLVMLSFFFTVILYFIITEYAYGQTIGRKLTNTTVINN